MTRYHLPYLPWPLWAAKQGRRRGLCQWAVHQFTVVYGSDNYCPHKNEIRSHSNDTYYIGQNFIITSGHFLPIWTAFRGPFHQHFERKGRAAFAEIILRLFYGNSIWQHCTKIGTHHKSYSLKYAVKFHCKCWQNRRASVAPFTLLWWPYVLCKLLGEIDTRSWLVYPALSS